MGHYRIAVVNDDQPYIEMMADILSDEGYHTVSCLAGAGAYELVQQEQPDLLILDIKLEQPDTGLNVLQMLRLNRETANLPVIICSADRQYLTANEQQFRAAHCDILPKPFDLDTLLEMITRNLPPTRRNVSGYISDRQHSQAGL